MSDTPPYERPSGLTQELTLSIGGQQVPYRAQADWLVLNRNDKPLADVFHVFYGRPEAAEERPLTFVFNGGPGAASAFLHLAGLGPRTLQMGAHGTLLAPPPRLVDNQHTWFLFTDLVFVDPVGTGFSRPVLLPPVDKDKEGQPNQEFFDVARDLEAMCEFICQFLSAHNCWSRPIYVAGESYGGFRVGRLCRMLQEAYGVGMSGAILITPGLEFGLFYGTDYDTVHWVGLFPSLVLTAVHHGRSRSVARDTPAAQVRHEAEHFACHDLCTLLTAGDMKDEDWRRSCCNRIADWLGLPPALVWEHQGRVPRDVFLRELLRDQRLVCGAYDSTITAVDPYPERPVYGGADPTLAAVRRAFTTGINMHLRETLKVQTSREYVLLNREVNDHWKQQKHPFETLSGATDDLRYGLSLNPHMGVLAACGYYDLATPYFSIGRLLHLMKLPPTQRERLAFHAYPGGHMFYTWDASRVAFYQDARAFYENLAARRQASMSESTVIR